MMLRALRHVGFAFWLGVLTLVVGAVQQGQLSTSTIDGAFADASMMKRMGHTMAQHQTAQHAQHDGAGHTHKGHADCAVCGATDALAFLTVAVALPIILPPVLTPATDQAAFAFALTAASAASYASRAPPIFLG